MKRLIPARAHTEGDAIVHFRKGNIIHMGDVYNGSYPFIDTSDNKDNP
jgi:cyclase